MNPPRVRVFAPPERATGIEAVFMGSNVKSISGARIFIYPWGDDVSVFRLKRKWTKNAWYLSDRVEKTIERRGHFTNYTYLYAV